jgi:hypothetical protein
MTPEVPARVPAKFRIDRCIAEASARAHVAPIHTHAKILKKEKPPRQTPVLYVII